MPITGRNGKSVHGKNKQAGFKGKSIRQNFIEIAEKVESKARSYDMTEGKISRLQVLTSVSAGPPLLGGGRGAEGPHGQVGGLGLAGVVPRPQLRHAPLQPPDLRHHGGGRRCGGGGVPGKRFRI